MKKKTKAVLVNHRFMRSKETLNEVPFLIHEKYYRTSVNRMYYACYYAVNALLLKHNISAKTHSGVLQQFGLHFIKTEKVPKDAGVFYSTLFSNRLSGDYSDFIEFDKPTVEDMHCSAKKFVQAIEKLL